MSVEIDESVPGAGFRALGLHPAICAAVLARGYERPTPVQTRLLAPEFVGRDLLVSAQTGSGKTAAFGFLLAQGLDALANPQGSPAKTERGPCAPQALVVAPTRELAQQVSAELSWILQPAGMRVLAVTGGTNVGGDLRALSRGAEVLVGTPGRLVDHLERGSLDCKSTATVVLDEADEMLDMGFRDELEAILSALPAKRRTILLSATLPEPIVALAHRYQQQAARITVDPVGRAHEDIRHVAHIVAAQERDDCVINLLLGAGDEKVMVFVRTRADAGELAGKLAELGFGAAPLTGEMAQAERTRTLEAFRSGGISVLVATDVAARGIDVPEVTHVIHADLPGDSAALTHRAGRTGRAGRKGTSVLVVPSFARTRCQELLRAAHLRARWEAPPSPGDILKAQEARLLAKLTIATTIPPTTASEATPVSETTPTPDRYDELSQKLLADQSPERIVAQLLRTLRWEGPCAPKTLRSFEPRLSPTERPARGELRGPRVQEEYRMFRTNFGAEDGATAARLLAMVCRRGNIRGTDVGKIDIRDRYSLFGVAERVAQDFAGQSARPDPRGGPFTIGNPTGHEGKAFPAPKRRDREGPRSFRPTERT